MHITLFRALKSIRINDDTAAAVVDALEEHMSERMVEAIKPLQAQITSTEKNLVKEIKALRGQITFASFFLGLVGLAITGATLAARFIN